MLVLLTEGIDRAVYLRSMHQRFSTPNPNLWRDILLGVTIVGGLLAVAWAAWLWQRRRSELGEMNAAALYRHLLTRLRLPAGDAWRLWWLARTLRTPHPAAMLISPELYDEAVSRYCAGSGLLGSRKRAAPQFAAIRARLFGG